MAKIYGLHRERSRHLNTSLLSRFGPTLSCSIAEILRHDSVVALREEYWSGSIFIETCRAQLSRTLFIKYK